MSTKSRQTGDRSNSLDDSFKGKYLHFTTSAFMFPRNPLEGTFVQACTQCKGQQRCHAKISLTFEQHPPNIKPSMAPTASHCGMVSINIRPARPTSFEYAGRWSEMPYISAFSRDGPALITLGVMMVPLLLFCTACDSRRVWRRLAADREVIDVEERTTSRGKLNKLWKKIAPFEDTG
jgi:hypothetical protein